MSHSYDDEKSMFLIILKHFLSFSPWVRWSKYTTVRINYLPHWGLNSHRWIRRPTCYQMSHPCLFKPVPFFQIEPLDYEEYVQQQRRARPPLGQPGSLNTPGSSSDPAQSLIDFPGDDIEVNIVPRKIRTLGHVLPEEPM